MAGCEILFDGCDPHATIDTDNASAIIKLFITKLFSNKYREKFQNFSQHTL
jgi:hypothetical protein